MSTGGPCTRAGSPSARRGAELSLVLGIDEAGRGPALGPLVVAAVALRPARAAALTRRGVCDSKAFGAGEEARARRAELAAHVARLADSVGVEVFDHLEVDHYTRRGRLNELERRAARGLIAAAPETRRIVADGLQVFGPLRREFRHLDVYDDGESAHVAVAAASIVAKDTRDRLFLEIAARYREEFGELRGGGYVNAATAEFLRRYHRRYGCLPPETRRSWSWKVILELEPPPLPLFDAVPEPPPDPADLPGTEAPPAGARPGSRSPRSS